MGWQRKLLRVDLTAGSCKSEPLNMEWAKAFLGQREHDRHQRFAASRTTIS